jgi:DNA-binding winged helix-turn-helix (wHTH) protein
VVRGRWAAARAGSERGKGCKRAPLDEVVLRGVIHCELGSGNRVPACPLYRRQDETESPYRYFDFDLGWLALGTERSEKTRGLLLRFGVFQLDLEAGEISKNGSRIPLQDQPFRVLAILLERPGRVVTREELQQKLLAEDTFVEFDRSLNTAVNKVRDALGDSAMSPQFVETVPRRGYRFIAPVGIIAHGDNPEPGGENRGCSSSHR